MSAQVEGSQDQRLSPSQSSEAAQPTVSFNDQLIKASIQAAKRASRAAEFGLEWLALGLALAGAHLLFVAVPRARLTFLDLFIVALTVGGGLTMLRFEVRRGKDLRELSARLQEEAANAK
jgi:hypothetical protein